MKRLLIVSNRLPVKIYEEENKLKVLPSAGGLATGLKSYHKNQDSLWIGWPGLNTDDKKTKKEIETILKKEHCSPVYLSDELFDNYYNGFSNTTLWPLFHYFTEYTEFKERYLEAYRKVNELFADAIIEKAEKGDTVWVHDYQLLLLPKMLKDKRPDLTIGFFLHIPFPSFEVFRILPWRTEILSGILGSDLIGFHTYDYARHFISATKRLLGYEVSFNEITFNSRHVFIDVFPMGIDYKKFEKKALEIQSRPIQQRSKDHQEIDKFLLASPGRKMILSIDRLDYTKGIPNRLKAFRHFLKKYPEQKEKVSLVLLTVPSRVMVEKYKKLKNELEKLVGSINGEFGTINWNPVIYFYRSLPFENLIELYISADIALLTPLRDGMNLVAKEYIATLTNQKGVLILSEMAGAAKELGEALTVNPNNVEDVSEAIYKALTMPETEQKKTVAAMQKRLKRYDVFKWASDFVNSLYKTQQKHEEYQARKVSQNLQNSIVKQYQAAKERVLFLDYDGTLQGFYDDPSAAKPDKELFEILDRIASEQKTELVLISGRDKVTFDKWFGRKNYTLIAEHGAWLKQKDKKWRERKPEQSEWKNVVLPVLEAYVDRTPGSLIEDKTYSLVWHYRKADIELGALRALELKTDISSLIENSNLEILEGNKVIEVKVSGINKGTAAGEFLQQYNFDFVLAIGDDWTDEFLFKELPDNAFTIKVGSFNSAAKYYVNNYKDVRKLLTTIKIDK